MRIKYEVKNMHCTGCENRIKNSLKMVKGVKGVEANHTTGEVIVTLKDSKMKDSIKKLLDDLDFLVMSVSELQ